MGWQFFDNTGALRTTDPFGRGVVYSPTPPQRTDVIWVDTASDNANFPPPGSYCKIFKSANQSIPSVWTRITYDSEVVDGEGMHSTVTNTDRITCVTPGAYSVSVHSMWASTAAAIQIGQRVLHYNSANVLISAAGGVIYGETFCNTKSTTSFDNMFGASVVLMNAGDYLVHDMFCNIGHNAFGGEEGYTYLSAVRVAARL